MKKFRLRRNNKNIFFPVFAAITSSLVGVSLLIYSLAASDVKLYLTPASQTVQKGASFSVKIYLDDSSTYISTVRAYLNFPAATLEVTSLSAAGSSFGVQSELTFNNSSGTIHITRSHYYPQTGTGRLVATINFKAKNCRNGKSFIYK